MASMVTDDVLFENRHSQERHERGLSEALAQHQLVREKAIQFLDIQALQFETERANQIADNAQLILELEAKKAEAAIRAREAENARRLIPQPPPRVKTPPPPPSPVAPTFQEPAPVPSPPAQPVQSAQTAAAVLPPAFQQLNQPVQPPPRVVHPEAQIVTAAQPANPFQTSQPPPRSILQPSQPTLDTISPSAPSSVDPIESAIIDARVVALRQIHTECKNLRKYIAGMPRPLKNEAGIMRRKIKMTLGQLTSESNKQQATNLREIFTKSLTFTSDNADPRIFMVQKSVPPVDDAVHNGEGMPSMFLYVMNIFAKAIIGQLINEASTRAEAAEPIGVLAHVIFSNPDYQWRGCSFIDILIAKYYSSCPILFGSTGNERTKEGRMSIGWKHDDGNPVSQAQHNSNMTGLAVGYAALTLRNYLRSNRQNPYAPHHYWTAISTITSTDPGLVCLSQYTVLKALVEHHYEKFVAFYGDQALAALRVAVVSFPALAKESTIEVKSLQVLADKWRNEDGFYVT